MNEKKVNRLIKHINEAVNWLVLSKENQAREAQANSAATSNDDKIAMFENFFADSK